MADSGARYALTRNALEIMTAWAAEGNSTDFAMQRLSVILTERGGDPRDGTAELLAGFVNLCGAILMDEATMTGEDEATILQRVAIKVADK
ncbi:MAG: hypothetical protein ACR2P2_18000 [Nakamurella sp.]